MAILAIGNLQVAERLCRHTARLRLRLRRAFPSYDIAGLYDPKN